MESSVSTWDTRKTCQINISFASFVLHIVLATICTLLDRVFFDGGHRNPRSTREHKMEATQFAEAEWAARQFGTTTESFQMHPKLGETGIHRRVAPLPTRPASSGACARMRVSEG